MGVDVFSRHLTLDCQPAHSRYKNYEVFYAYRSRFALEINAISVSVESVSDKWSLQVIDYKSAGHPLPAFPPLMTSGFIHTDHFLSDLNLTLSGVFLGAKVICPWCQHPQREPLQTQRLPDPGL